MESRSFIAQRDEDRLGICRIGVDALDVIVRQVQSRLEPNAAPIDAAVKAQPIDRRVKDGRGPCREAHPNDSPSERAFDNR